MRLAAPAPVLVALLLALAHPAPAWAQAIQISRSSTTDPQKGTRSDPWMVGDPTTLGGTFTPASLQDEPLNIYQYRAGTSNPQPYIVGMTAAQLGATCSATACWLSGVFAAPDLCDRNGITARAQVTDRIELASNPAVGSSITWWADCTFTTPRCTTTGAYAFAGDFLHQVDLLFTKRAELFGSVLFSVAGANGEPNSAHRIAYLKGDHYQRGYAHGYLLADEIRTLFAEYIFGYWFQGNGQCSAQLCDLYTYSQSDPACCAAVGNRPLYDYYRGNLDRFVFSGGDLQELQGMLDGIAANGGLGLSIGRDLAVDDLKMIQLEADWSQYMAEAIQCSSDSFSGRFTRHGGPVSFRNLDFPVSPLLHLEQNHTIFLVENETGFRYVAILAPGTIGVATGFNQAGVFVGLDSAKEQRGAQQQYLHQLSGGRLATQLFLRELLETMTADDLASRIAGKYLVSANVPTVAGPHEMAVLELGSWGIDLRGPLTPLYPPSLVGDFPQDPDALHNLNSYFSASGHVFWGGTLQDDAVLEKLYLLQQYTLNDFVALRGLNQIDAEAAFNLDRGWIKNVDELVWRTGCDATTSTAANLASFHRVTFDSASLDFVVGFGTPAYDSVNESVVKPLSYNFQQLFGFAVTQATVPDGGTPTDGGLSDGGLTDGGLTDAGFVPTDSGLPGPDAAAVGYTADAQCGQDETCDLSRGVCQPTTPPPHVNAACGCRTRDSEGAPAALGLLALLLLTGRRRTATHPRLNRYLAFLEDEGAAGRMLVAAPAEPHCSLAPAPPGTS